MVSSFHSRRRSVRQQSSRRGFVLIAMAVALLLLVAMMGLAFDVGRIYIARNEAQVFTDAAAMAAAAKLDGTSAGVTRARQAVARLPIRWNLGTSAFTGVVIEFSADGSRWVREPGEVAGGAAEGVARGTAPYTMARVTAPANNVDIVFLRAVGGPASFTVPARSIAASNPVRLTE
jgi:uncharacterized membrane protein